MKKPIRSKSKPRSSNHKGFTLTELAVSTAIIGTLTAVGVPIYTSQIKSNCQKIAQANISALLSQSQAFKDEFGIPPSSWSDLDKIATFMTTEGPAKVDNFGRIVEPSCRYAISGKETEGTIAFAAKPAKENSEAEIITEGNQNIQRPPNIYSVAGCINTSTGTSQIIRSDDKSEVSIDDPICE